MVRGIGASRVYLVEEGLAAAIGAKPPVAEMKASMVVDVGGATTSIAVAANAGVVESETLRIGGLDMDRAITDYMPSGDTTRSAETFNFRNFGPTRTCLIWV